MSILKQVLDLILLYVELSCLIDLQPTRRHSVSSENNIVILRGTKAKNCALLRHGAFTTHLSNAVKNIYNNKATPLLDIYLQIWQQIIQYKGNGRDLSKNKIGSGVK